MRELVPSGGGGSSGGRGGRASRGQPDLNRLHELLTQNPAATAGSEERLLKRVRDQLLSLPGGAEHAIATAFKSFDTDGDGSLSRQEFRNGVSSLQLGLGVHEIDRLLELADEVCTLLHILFLCRSQLSRQPFSFRNASICQDGLGTKLHTETRDTKISFRFVSFRFVSFRFVSFRFVSFRFV